MKSSIWNKLPTKPYVYFAGKISAVDWRQDIFGLRAGSFALADDPERDTLFNPHFRIDKQKFYYGGPFFISCDHNCFHSLYGHGAGPNGCSGDAISLSAHQGRIWKINRHRIKTAHIIFAYINERDCFGTMAEIGMAQAMDKPIFIGFGPNADYQDMWMLRQAAKVTVSSAARESSMRVPLKAGKYPSERRSHFQLMSAGFAFRMEMNKAESNLIGRAKPPCSALVRSTSAVRINRALSEVRAWGDIANQPLRSYDTVERKYDC